MQETNKRIAVNTILLYFRTLLIMVITLYTSRVVLSTLGVENYGIYNIVGGIVASFSVISSSIASSISRFITFEIGKGNPKKLGEIFSTSINIQIIISIIVVIIGELAGVWFINNKLNIPPDRLWAANWVFQCSLLTFVINLISVPYNALIIAHEKMSAFAYISILEAVLKLAIVFTLIFSPYDKLVTYGLLMVVVSIIIRMTYSLYCNRHFKESKYQYVLDKPLIREMTSFAGWGFFGHSAYMLNVQGVDVLINIFFGVTMNAARGIVVQVQNAVMQFVNNFTTAVNPQITKSYAAKDMEYMFSLICRGAKFSYFLLLLFLVPICCEAEYILQLWLKEVPEYAPIFLRLTLLGSLMLILGNSTLTGILATGKIRSYQIWISFWGCWVFPLTWIAYKCGLHVTATYYIYIIVYFLLNFVRLYFAKNLLHFPIFLYLKEVVLKTLTVTLLAFILPLLSVYYLDSSAIRFFSTCIIGVLSTILFVTTIGLTGKERIKIYSLINKYCNKIR